MPEKMSNFFNQFDYASLLQNAIRIVIIIVVAYLIWGIIRYVIGRMGDRIVKHSENRGEDAEHAKRRAGTLTSLVRKVIAAVYWVAVALTLLSQIGIDIGALIAAAGILGLAFSFGAQDLIKNYIAGFFLVLEDQISIGDIVTLDGTTGTVEAIHFRTTILRGADGAVHVFGNSTINVLSNLTRGWSGYLYEIAIDYEQDVDRAIEVIKKVGSELRGDPEFGKSVTEDIEVWGVNKLADNAMLITGRLKTVPGGHWATGRAFLARLKKAFDDAGINPNPNPQQIMLFDSKGPPLRLSQSAE
ncbi:MAG: mechanosensitive ion channel family protein [Gammaproteobacteria bacterium]|nr:mechanosensitive ion channel family protein [Gammaproteobacteria bacterium]